MIQMAEFEWQWFVGFDPRLVTIALIGVSGGYRCGWEGSAFIANHSRNLRPRHE